MHVIICSAENAPQKARSVSEFGPELMRRSGIHLEAVKEFFWRRANIPLVIIIEREIYTQEQINLLLEQIGILMTCMGPKPLFNDVCSYQGLFTYTDVDAELRAFPGIKPVSSFVDTYNWTKFDGLLPRHKIPVFVPDMKIHWYIGAPVDNRVVFRYPGSPHEAQF